MFRIRYNSGKIEKGFRTHKAAEDVLFKRGWIISAACMYYLHFGGKNGGSAAIEKVTKKGPELSLFLPKPKPSRK